MQVLLLMMLEHQLELNLKTILIKVQLKFLYFAMFALFLEFGARTRPQDLQPFLISETGPKFLV